jgi:hypothetical protein
LAHGEPGEGNPEAAPSPDSVNSISLRYLNRLSDLLFVLARTLARAGGGREIAWRNRQDRTQTRPGQARQPRPRRPRPGSP